MACWQNADITLGYDRLGDHLAPAVVLVSGLAMPRQMWPDALIQGLLANHVQVITIDNRDCGQSMYACQETPTLSDVLVAIGKTLARRPVHAPYALEAMALDIERLLQHLNIERALVVGLSMGAMIGQVLAYQCPNRLSGLVSIGGASGNPATGLGQFQAIWRLLRAPHAVTNPEDKVRHFDEVIQALSGSLYGYTENEKRQWQPKVREMPFSQVGEFRQLMAILASGDRRHALKQIRLPSLIIHGQEDPLLPKEAGLECAALIPEARLEIISGMGHWMTESVSPLMVELIVAHMQRHP